MAADPNHTPYRALALWTGWLLGPLAWGVHLMASYLLVSWVCAGGGRWALHAVTVATAALALLAGLIAYVQWRPTRGGGQGGHGARERVRFMAVGGTIISALMVLIIIAEGIPNFIVSPCT